MSIVQESGIEFNFNSAAQIFRHDDSGPGCDGNKSIWKGIDFRVNNGSTWLWIEVKSWDPTRVDPHRRGGNQQKFIGKMRSKEFAAEIRAKFLGTSAFLAWNGTFLPADVVYIVLFEPPRSVDKALMGALLTKVDSMFVHNFPWAQSISCVLLDVDDWNFYYPQYPAQIL